MNVKNILLVDDDAEDREFFISVVCQIDPAIKVATASGKEELFSELQKQQPDLLFIDSFLNYESGISGITEIRNQSELVNLPIVMYSGSADTRNMKQAFAAGASLYVVKPQSLQEMKCVLQEVLHIDWNQRGTGIKEYYIDGVIKPCE